MILGIILGFYIFYLIIKAAVRNGIREAGLGIDPPPDTGRSITLIPCPNCNQGHAPSSRVCPHCGYEYDK